MGYVVEYDKGPWKDRYDSVSRLDPRVQQRFSDQELEILNRSEAGLRDWFRVFLSTGDVGLRLSQFVSAIRGDKWTLCLSSLTQDLTHDLVRVEINDTGLIVGDRTAPFALKCDHCLGRRIPPVKPFGPSDEISSRTIQRRLEETPGFLGPEYHGIPARIRNADRQISHLIDTSRGKGLLDPPVKVVEAAFWKMPTKHVLSYRILLVARFEGERGCCLGDLGEISPIARHAAADGTRVSSVWEAASESAYEHWEPRYWKPCPVCLGSGLRARANGGD